MNEELIQKMLKLTASLNERINRLESRVKTLEGRPECKCEKCRVARYAQSGVHMGPM